MPQCFTKFNEELVVAIYTLLCFHYEHSSETVSVKKMSVVKSISFQLEIRKHSVVPALWDPLLFTLLGKYGY